MNIRTFLCSLFLGLLLTCKPAIAADTFVSTNEQGFLWIQPGKAYPILTDKNEYKGVLRAIDNLQTDAQKVTGVRPEIKYACEGLTKCLIIGSIEENTWIKELISQGAIDANELNGKREKYIIQTVKSPFNDSSIEEAVVIAGSDKRGAIYGIYELSSQMGVSPWYYWADVPVAKHKSISILPGVYTDGEPAVELRGIFLNDEWPSLGNWAQETFGGFNSRFYETVFELVLRLKGNFMWPAMWNSAFYDDDAQNGILADEMGIVMGTSHHEPMGLAQQDWKRRGTGAWDYTKNGAVLRDFWTKGMERCKDWEKIITVGMRGDGDEPMSENANISLLQNIVKDQRKIITKVTGKKASETPQVWALYKEVQDYYDKGMRVPDDVTLLLCDDNWGNVRKLPSLSAKPRKGGYGMYYHFDYVGGPRNSKWVNISQVQRVWEQMNLTYEYGVKKLWIVNVGDLKPMEYPITFFLDMAWNPKRFNENNLLQHTVDFCAQQFGPEHAREAARLINTYTKYNRRVTPEMLDADIYSLENYNEWQRVKDDYVALSLDALKLYYLMPEACRDAYDQLVLFPIQACANLYEMYYAVARSHQLAAQGNPEANEWAQKAKECYERDSILTYQYHHVMSNGKWNHIMDQTHIGYKIWQQPEHQVMPAVKEVAVPAKKPAVFTEKDGYISIEAEHYTRHSEGGNAHWIVIPDMGHTLSAITTMPCTEQPDENLYVEYDLDVATAGEAKVIVRLSPTLNFNDKGLRYAISIDGEDEKVINFNGHYNGELGLWQKDHMINSSTTCTFKQAGKHRLRFRALDPGVVLQKIMIDFGGLKPSYLGAPESK
ncbi:MAG: glycosyl hydrolase 115 family protein [Bacteroides sp.]|nr:glycosyl hydrolase 115 family protein [Bacteroides sp.]